MPRWTHQMAFFNTETNITNAQTGQAGMRGYKASSVGWQEGTYTCDLCAAQGTQWG